MKSLVMLSLSKQIRFEKRDSKDAFNRLKLTVRLAQADSSFLINESLVMLSSSKQIRFEKRNSKTAFD